MSSAASVFQPLQMAESCLTTVTTLFTTKNQYPFHSFTSKSIKLPNLSRSSSQASLTHLSLKQKSSPFHLIPLVAQTSDWAQQEEGDNPVEDNEKEEVGSDWESSGTEVVNENEESDPEPPEDAKLFVGNLPYDIDSEKLAELFNQAGIVEIAEVIYNRETDQSRGFGFVTMSTVEEAENAVEKFHRYDLGGRLLTVNKAAPRGSRPERSQTDEPSFRVYVGNLPWQVDDARLEQVFSEHGKVVNVRVVYDRETGRSRGFGFVTMSSETEVNDAIAALDGQSLDGRAIRVNVAEGRPSRSSFSF